MGNISADQTMYERIALSAREKHPARGLIGNPTFDLSGGWVWIWNASNCDSGDAAAIALRLKRAGVRGAIVKIADGGSAFLQNGQNPWIFVNALIAQGVDVLTWSYCYGASAAIEANAVNAVLSHCPDVIAHFLDVEQEVEDSADPAGYALELVKRIASGIPLAYAPLPAIRYHQRLPYYQLSVVAGLPISPQLYWTGLQWTPEQTVDTFVADMASFGLGSGPVLPSYEDAVSAGAGATADDCALFAQLALQQGWRGVAVWSYEHMDSGAWTRLSAIVAALAPSPDPTPTPTPTPTPEPTVTRIAYAQIGANIVNAALDPDLSDADAATALTDAAYDIYGLTWPSATRPEGTIQL